MYVRTIFTHLLLIPNNINSYATPSTHLLKSLTQYNLFLASTVKGTPSRGCRHTQHAKQSGWNVSPRARITWRIREWRTERASYDMSWLRELSNRIAPGMDFCSTSEHTYIHTYVHACMYVHTCYTVMWWWCDGGYQTLFIHQQWSVIVKY